MSANHEYRMKFMEEEFFPLREIDKKMDNIRNLRLRVLNGSVSAREGLVAALVALLSSHPKRVALKASESKGALDLPCYYELKLSSEYYSEGLANSFQPIELETSIIASAQDRLGHLRGSNE